MRLLALVLLSVLVGAPYAGLAAVRAGALALDRDQISVPLDGAVTARVLALGDPMRLVVDIDGVDAGRQELPGSGNIRKAKIGQFDGATARIVIELAQPMRIGTASQRGDNSLQLKLVPIGKRDFEAAIKTGRRVLPLASPPKVAVNDPAPVPPVKPPSDAPPPQSAKQGNDFDLPTGVFIGPTPPLGTNIPKVAPPPRSGGPKPLVVIDAGHGGKDAGAISVNGTYEKDVTLAIAKAAQRALNASGLVRVILTRGDDRFIPLGGRVAIARAAHADLFVSVHADSAPNAEARGASVYTLSTTASDEVAARLAARENKSDIIAGVNLGIEAPEVGDILIDLLQRNTMNVSIAFAETLQSELDDRIAFRGEFHHFAGFRVLKAADIPSVLLETGYVSNQDDANLLFSRNGQKIIGDGIARAVEAHLLRGRVSRGKPAETGA